MNQHEIRLLQNNVSAPALTITMPTHRTFPENRQDPIRLKNLVEQAAVRLRQEFSKSEVEPLLLKLETLVGQLDYRYTLAGLALFVNREVAHAVQLPFSLKECVSVGETFLTRDLIFAMNRTPRYWVLVLSEKPTRLYEGTRDVLMEIQEGGFPVTHEGAGGEQPLPGGFGIKKSAYRDERHRQFFRQVDRALAPFLKDDPLPLMVVGVERYLAFFAEVTNHKDSILTTLTGSHDKTYLHELSKLVWPLVKDALAEQRQQVLSDFDQAVGEKKVASTIGEVWQMASEGRGHLLLVEESFRYPANTDQAGRHLFPAGESAGGEKMDDAVDIIIDMVLSKQGKVVFMENGQLAKYQRIALILRY